MSFMSVPALDRLLEPTERGATSSTQSTTASAGKGMDRESVLVRNPSLPFYPAYPYSTPPAPPSPRPRTPSPSSFSPSPYVLNFKRRVFGGTSNAKAVAAEPSEPDATPQSTSGSRSHAEPSSFRAKTEAAASDRGDHRQSSASPSPGQKERTVNGKSTMLNDDGLLPVREVQNQLRIAGKPASGNKKIDKLSSKLMSKAEAKSEGPLREASREGLRGHRASSGGGGGRPLVQEDSGLSFISSSTAEEFFDAPEAPLDDYTSDEEGLRTGQTSARSSSSVRGDSDGNLEWQLDQEIKRRIAAEDAMVVLQQQRNEMACHLAFIDGGGLGLIDDARDIWDAAYQAEKMVVARTVASSIARGAARAEAADELESVVADKNREVARLRDKLQYYELVNHEMSQRNQEAIENARRRRHRRQSRNRWLVGGAGAAVCVGVSAALMYQFVPWASLRVRAGAALGNLRSPGMERYPSLPPPSRLVNA